MKNIFTLLLFTFSQTLLLGQELNFREIVEINDFRSAESLMYKNEFRNIENNIFYKYSEISKTKCSENNDNCEWACGYTEYWKTIKESKIPINNINYNFYKELYKRKSVFAKNYNSSIEKATTFLEVTNEILSTNGNCEKILKPISDRFILDIQFNNLDDFRELKKQINANAFYYETIPNNGNPSAIYRFKKGGGIISNYDEGITFYIDENDYSGHIMISYNNTFYP